ncbi:MAG: hypothetical protein QOH60_1549 [Mycobacterium sp.]|jgi:hypothetical protein|nr:hypothetical protein [Mycobacterium sp.]
MSGFDTSQPITDETALKNVHMSGKTDKSVQSATDEDGTDRADELGDATPGPR